MRRPSRLLVPSLFCLAVAAAQDEPPAEAVKKIEAAGGQVLAIAQNDKRLEVSFRGADDLKSEDLAALAELPDLAWLRLGGTPVDDAGLAHLSGIASLEKLNLEKTKITDAGLAHLAGLENLTYLNLYGTEIGDAGLDHLQGLKKLQKLYLWQTKVTDAGVEALKQAIPGLGVDRGWTPPPPPDAEPAGRPDAEEPE